MNAETKLNVQAPKAVVHHTKSWFKTVFSCSPLASKEIKRKCLFSLEVESYLKMEFSGCYFVWGHCCCCFFMSSFSNVEICCPATHSNNMSREKKVFFIFKV